MTLTVKHFSLSFVLPLSVSDALGSTGAEHICLNGSQCEVGQKCKTKHLLRRPKEPPKIKL